MASRKRKSRKSRSGKREKYHIILYKKLILSFLVSFIIGFSLGIIGAFLDIPNLLISTLSGTISGVCVVLILSGEAEIKKYL